MSEQQERGKTEQLRSENTIAPRRLTRHQLIAAVRKENPDLKYGSDLFHECVVANAIEQEGGNLQRLSNFLGMSKGAVRNHVIKIQRKINAAMATPVESAVEKAIKEYEASTDKGTTAEREDVDNGVDETQTAELDHSDVPAVSS